jgi:hypothetical protein
MTLSLSTGLVAAGFLVLAAAPAASAAPVTVDLRIEGPTRTLFEGPGRYVLDAVAIDGAGNRTPLACGSSRVVFAVR